MNHARHAAASLSREAICSRPWGNSPVRIRTHARADLSNLISVPIQELRNSVRKSNSNRAEEYTTSFCFKRQRSPLVLHCVLRKQDFALCSKYAVIQNLHYIMRMRWISLDPPSYFHKLVRYNCEPSATDARTLLNTFPATNSFCSADGSQCAAQNNLVGLVPEENKPWS